MRGVGLYVFFHTNRALFIMIQHALKKQRLHGGSARRIVGSDVQVRLLYQFIIIVQRIPSSLNITFRVLLVCTRKVTTMTSAWRRLTKNVPVPASAVKEKLVHKTATAKTHHHEPWYVFTAGVSFFPFYFNMTLVYLYREKV